MKENLLNCKTTGYAIRIIGFFSRVTSWMDIEKAECGVLGTSGV